MRKLMLAPALMLAVLASATLPDPTVYKTRTGEKYHRESCSSLRKSKIAIKLSQAKAEGLGACKRCDPPR